MEPILDSMPAIRGVGRGHPRRRPVKLHADKGYDIPGSAATCAAAGSPPGSPASAGTPAHRLGRHRWVVERTIGWLLSYKRLALRYDRSAATITALARLADHPDLRPPPTRRTNATSSKWAAGTRGGLAGWSRRDADASGVVAVGNQEEDRLFQNCLDGDVRCPGLVERGDDLVVVAA